MERAALRDGGACRETQWSAERSMTAYGASERVWTEEREECNVAERERACALWRAIERRRETRER